MKKSISKFLFSIAPKKSIIQVVVKYLQNLIRDRVTDMAIRALLLDVLTTLRLFAFIFLDGNQENNSGQIEIFTKWASSFWIARGATLLQPHVKGLDLDQVINANSANATQHQLTIESWMN